MSSFVKCYDTVSMVIDEATSRFAPLWKENRESKRILAQYCRVIDDLVNEFDGESLEVDVDEIQMTISIKIECQDITLESQKHKYYGLASRAVSFGFSVSNNGNLVVEFVFPSIWERAT